MGFGKNDDYQKRRQETKTRKKNKRKGKSAQALFIEKMKKSNDVHGGKIIVEPKGAEKMSEVILHFAEPFLEECKDEETEKKVIGLAILIWNVSLLPKEKQGQAVQKICSDTSSSNDADGFATALHYVNMLLERKKGISLTIKEPFGIIKFQDLAEIAA